MISASGKDALRRLPHSMTFVDVETTGLFSSDRVVSLGIVSVDVAALKEGSFHADCQHLVFDPCRKSHPRAQQVHGYDDWTLRHQELFADRAAEVLPLVSGGGLVAAHNSNFDHAFIAGEFERAGLPFERKSFFCTMQEYRQMCGGRANLDTALVRMGLPPRQGRHGALQDAWSAMLVYLWLRGLPLPPLSEMPTYGPTNFRPAPPLPAGPIPRRRRRKPGDVAAGDATTTTVAEAPPEAESVELELHVDELMVEVELPDRSRILPIVDQARPVATALMWLARADGRADESELDVIADYFRRWSAFAGETFSPQEIRDGAAMLFDLEPSREELEAAARVIVRDQAALAVLGPLSRLVVNADGHGSSAEAAAVRALADSIAVARAGRFTA